MCYNNNMNKTPITRSKKNETYVVVRDNFRVSDKEYLNTADAENELSFWQRVVKRWPDGTKVELVKKDNKRHRIYNVE